MGAGNGETALSAGDFAQRAGTLQKGVSFFAGLGEFSKVGRNCRSIDYQRFVLVGRNQVRPVFIMYGDAFALQLVSEL